jgi:hypothetical protein
VQRARGAYVATVCQPEAAFDLSTAAQITEPMSDDIKKLNKRLEWQKENSSRGLTFVPLKVGVTSKVGVTPKTGETPNSEVVGVPLKLVVFTDSSFANNADYSSQIGYIIALADNEDNANILHCSSTKCKRITRSTLASELYGMVNRFDIGAAIKKTIENITKIDNLPLLLCTDSKSLYEYLVKLETTHKKRLMVDIMCLRQSYERREITKVIWIDRDSNPADAMTKSRPCQALRDLIDSNRIDLRAMGWVERNQQGVIPAEKGNTVNSTKNKEFPVCNPPNSDPELRPKTLNSESDHNSDRTSDGPDRTVRIAPTNRNATCRPDRDNNRSGG